MSDVGIVVPTMGTRPNFLQECLKSIQACGDAYVVVVAPEVNITKSLPSSLYNDIQLDRGKGLAAAINTGMDSFPEEINFVNWLGDDDTLVAPLELTANALRNREDAVLVWGGCNYVDTEGRTIWTNNMGLGAKSLMKFGPNLIPQPGALFRRSAFSEVGRLDESLGFAFDLDLFLRLSKLGKFVRLNKTLATFRWHSTSLTSSQRASSVSESRRVRERYYPRSIRPFRGLWEVPLSYASLLAGKHLKSLPSLGKIRG